MVEGDFLTVWRLNNEFAESDDIPGVRIPNASFPGVISVLPGPDQLVEMLRREKDLATPVAFPAILRGASPEHICGPSGIVVLNA